MNNVRVNLKGKTVLVTGGAKGIGEAIAVALAENGAAVVINYLSSANRAKDLMGKSRNIKRAIKADVSIPREVETMK